jgi:hypothetical protein
VEALLATEPDKAVMLAVPEEIAVTSPDWLTFATDVLLLDHDNVGHAITFPFWSLHAAVNCCVCPANIDIDVGDIEIVVRVGGWFTVNVPLAKAVLPAESVTVTVTLYVPTFDGIPVITFVFVFWRGAGNPVHV